VAEVVSKLAQLTGRALGRIGRDYRTTTGQTAQVVLLKRIRCKEASESYG